MKKITVLLLIVTTVLLLVFPVNMKALTLTEASRDGEVICRMEQNVSMARVRYVMEGCNDSLLGDPGDPNSVAWLLQQVLNFIKIVGPVLVIVLSSFDFVKVIIKSDDEAMQKAQKKLITRLILAALLFFIPIIAEVLLDLFGLTSASTCGLS